MKFMKGMKKLKFWSRKNKNKRKNQHYHYNTNQYFQLPHDRRPPPPSLPLSTGDAVCKCHFCRPVEPSAPPLPPWLESQLLKITQEGDSGTSWDDPFIIPTQDESAGPSSSTTSSSYQQYLAVNPVHELPVVPRKDKPAAKGGAFGCAVNVGSLLIRCIFPCFHISEPH